MSTVKLVSDGLSVAAGRGFVLPVGAKPASLGTAPDRLRRVRTDVVSIPAVVDCFALALAVLVVSSLTLLSTLVLGAIVLCLNAVGGLYKPRIALSLLDDLPGLAARALVAGALTSTIRPQLTLPMQSGPLYAAIAFLVFAILGRAVIYPLMRRQRRNDRVGTPTMIIGCGVVGNELARTLLERPEYGLEPVGFVDDDPVVAPADQRVPWLGGTDDLTRLLVEHRIRNVIIAFTTTPESVIVDTVRRCDRLSCEIFYVPRLYELHGSGARTELIWGVPLTRLTRASHRTVAWRSKRAFDLVLAMLGLVVLSPVLAACALAVRLESGPGIIFKQERVGLDSRRFTLYKFRSLRPVDEDESAQLWTIGADPRLGPVGRVLRRLSLDELPQLWNVIRGDMSLVGPRPERPVFVDEFTNRFPRYVTRHRVPVGLTGWAQINGLRGDTDIGDRATFDNHYIDNWSMWTDVKIMLRTVGQVFGGRGQ